MKEKLDKLIEGEIFTTRVLNIFVNEHSKNYYKLFGKYIIDNLDITKISILNIFSEIENRGFSINKKSKSLQTIGIFFITEVLNSEALRKIFGEPIYHNEFGEGFEGEYDEETDEYLEPERKESFASYMVDIDGVNFHIGYDHRGTSIEMEIDRPENYDVNVMPHLRYNEEIATKENAEKCLNCLKKK